MSAGYVTGCGLWLAVCVMSCRNTGNCTKCGNAENGVYSYTFDNTLTCTCVTIEWGHI